MATYDFTNLLNWNLSYSLAAAIDGKEKTMPWVSSESIRSIIPKWSTIDNVILTATYKLGGSSYTSDSSRVEIEFRRRWGTSSVNSEGEVSTSTSSRTYTTCTIAKKSASGTYKTITTPSLNDHYLFNSNTANAGEVLDNGGNGGEDDQNSHRNFYFKQWIFAVRDGAFRNIYCNDNKYSVEKQ